MQKKDLLFLKHRRIRFKTPLQFFIQSSGGSRI